MKTGIVIVTFNGAPWIAQCLDSIRRDAPHAYTVVIDNASTDGTVRSIASDFPFVDLVASPENVGFGRANNIGIARAMAHGCDATFLLNQDAYLLPQALQRLETFLEEHPAIGVVAPLHCGPTEDSIDQKTLNVYLRWFALDWLCDAALGREKPDYLIHGVNAAAWMVRREVWLRCGGFDPLYFMYGEDDDLLARWAEHGVQFSLLPPSRIVHLRQSPRQPQATWTQRVRRAATRQRSSLLLLIKRPRLSLSFMLLVLLVKGIWEPLLGHLLARNTVLLLGNWMASIGLLFEVRTVRIHTKKCSATGAHFLDVLEKK